jgi:hypothetical protein
MTGPGEIAAATGSGRLRASHADREQVVGTLKAAFVAGMLDKDEFELRVGQALAARTHAQLAVLTADLPAGLALAPPPRPARTRSGQPILRPGPVVRWATVLYAVAWAFALSPPAAGLVVFGGVVYLAVVAISVAAALENRRDMRPGGRLPRRQVPGASGPAVRRLPPAGPAGQLPPTDPGHRHAEAARSRRARPRLPVRGPCAGGALAARTAPASG